MQAGAPCFFRWQTLNMLADDEPADALVHRQGARTWLSDSLPYLIAGAIALGLIVTLVVVVARAR